MASRTTLKTYFEVGDTPTEANFIALIDSLAHVSEDSFATTAAVALKANITSATLVTPTLGVASATSINKMAITAPATSSTLAVADGKTLTASNTLTVTATDGSTLAVVEGGLLGSRTLVTDATTARTLVLTDAQKYVRFTSGAATVVTIPPQADVAWLADTEIEFERAGAGSLTIAPGAGVTLRNSRSLTGRAQYSVLKVKRVASNEWVVSGDMT